MDIAGQRAKLIESIKQEMKDHKARGSRYPFPGKPEMVAGLFEAQRRAIGKTHPDKTWGCKCGERTTLRESICWHCGATK